MKELTSLLVVVAGMKELVPLPLASKELAPLIFAAAVLVTTLGVAGLRAGCFAKCPTHQSPPDASSPS